MILITNAPRTAEAVEAQLGRIGLPRDCWDGIATSGEAGIAALKALAQPVGFLGTREDRAILEEQGLAIVTPAISPTSPAPASTSDRHRCRRLSRPARTLADRDVLIHCLNPDRRGDPRRRARSPAPGALADVY